MANGPFPFGILANTFDPNDPRYQGMNLPVPALSPQFQTLQMVPGEARSQALMPSEQQQIGPVAVNALPGQPNISNPAFANAGGMGAGFAGVPSPALAQAMPQAAPAPYSVPTPPDSAPYAPRQYADASGGFDYPQTTGATPQGKAGGMEDFGRRLQQAAAWIAPPGNAQAALGFQSAEDRRTQSGVDNTRADQELGLKRQMMLAQLMQSRAPQTKIEQSENGRFRTITRTNPLTGEVSFERQAIPEDEQSPEKAAFKPPASTDRDLNGDEDKLAKNVTLMTEGADIRDQFRAGQVDVSLLGKTAAELQTLANSGDPRAANAMRVQTFIQGAANAALRNEKGVQTDSDAKRVANEILSGNSRMNNKQVYDWMGRYMEQLDGDVRYRSGRSINTIKRYGAAFDPDGYRAQTYEGYAEAARTQRARDTDGNRSTPYTGQTASAPRVTSPLDERLRNRFGLPGAR